MPVATMAPTPPDLPESPTTDRADAEAPQPGQWWAVAAVDELERVGSFVARDVGGHSLIAVRADEQSFSVVENSCPHQDLPICVPSSRGRVRTLRCPFHGWAFTLDGRYVAPDLSRILPGLVPSPRGPAGRPDLRRYSAVVVAGVLFAGLPPPEPSPDPDPDLLSPEPLARCRDPRAGAVSVTRVDRPWRAVYEELCDQARTDSAGGALRRLGANALALADATGIRSMCAVVPRGRDTCTVVGSLERPAPDTSELPMSSDGEGV